MAKKTPPKRAPKPQPKPPTKAPTIVAAAPGSGHEGWPPTGVKLPYEDVRKRKTMLRHSLREEMAWKRCAARKPPAVANPTTAVSTGGA
jgi:hypothetical protein